MTFLSWFDRWFSLVRIAKLYMIDLAGSERAAQTQNTGRRMMEGRN